MQNLKITFYLNSPLIANRYLTFDNIILNALFKDLREKGVVKESFIETEDFIKKYGEFLPLKVKNDTLSGSVWYLDEKDDVMLYNYIAYKKTNTKKMMEYSKKFNKVDTSRKEFKTYMLGFEALVVSKIYFYASGDKEKIANLLKNVKYIGKKFSIGFGIVGDFKIEEIDADKSFTLDETTASKPLAVDKWDLKSKRIAYHRDMPPYYLKKDFKVCFMPPTSLIETKDESFKEGYEICKECLKSYISPAKFAKKYGGVEVEYQDFKMKKTAKRIKDEENLCIICGGVEKEGIKGNPRHYLPDTFNDYPYLDKGDFICENCLWSIKKEKTLGNSFISKEGIRYIQGSKSGLKGDESKEFYLNLDKQTPPFVISLKSTRNSQHTLFKGKVAVSNALVPVSFGNEFYFVDIPLLKKAYNEAKEILDSGGCIKKLHLLNFDDITKDKESVRFSKKCNREDIKKAMDFWKKYDRGVRKILSKIL